MVKQKDRKTLDEIREEFLQKNRKGVHITQKHLIEEF